MTAEGFEPPAFRSGVRLHVRVRCPATAHTAAAALVGGDFSSSIGCSSRSSSISNSSSSSRRRSSSSNSSSSSSSSSSWTMRPEGLQPQSCNRNPVVTAVVTATVPAGPTLRDLRWIWTLSLPIWSEVPSTTWAEVGRLGVRGGPLAAQHHLRCDQQAGRERYIPCCAAPLRVAVPRRLHRIPRPQR